MEDKPLIFLLHRLLFNGARLKVFEEIKEDYHAAEILERVYHHIEVSSFRD
jgi:hypothetical protein